MLHYPNFEKIVSQTNDIFLFVKSDTKCNHCRLYFINLSQGVYMGRSGMKWRKQPFADGAKNSRMDQVELLEDGL